MRKVVVVTISLLCVAGGVTLGLEFAWRAPAGVSAPNAPAQPQPNSGRPRNAKPQSLVDRVAPDSSPSPSSAPKHAAQPVKDAKPANPDDTLPERPGGWPKGIIG